MFTITGIQYRTMAAPTATDPDKVMAFGSITIKTDGRLVDIALTQAELEQLQADATDVAIAAVARMADSLDKDMVFHNDED